VGIFFRQATAYSVCVESKTRVLLSWSLGALVLLAAVAGIAALAIFQRVRTGEQQLRAGLLDRTNRLECIRAGVYSSGLLAESYFHAPDPPTLDRLNGLRDNTTRAAADYGDPNLRGELITWWRLVDLMTDLSTSRRKQALDAYFRAQLDARRTTVLRIASETSAALKRESERGEADVAALYRRSRAILAGAVVLIVFLGLIASIVTARRLCRLENDARTLSAQLLRAQEQERRAIARELHDDVGQMLSGLLLEAGNTGRVTELAGRAIDSVRRLALALRPSMLDDLGLVAALEWQAREVGNRSGLHVEVDALETAGELPEAQRICIFRVAQEALRNCSRHAKATRVRVALDRVATRVMLKVEDDGEGFQPARSKGLGLLGMEERVAQLGGRLRIDSQPGRGTTVTADLPV
jgi:signal transduction histidine kinase